MTMGERIKELREKMGMTQEELGAILGVQKSAIRKYEKGAVENIKRTSIKKMADLFGVSPAYLMCFDDPQPQILYENYKSNDDSFQQLINMLYQLDDTDRAEIKGEIKQMLRCEKYKVKNQKNA